MNWRERREIKKRERVLLRTFSRERDATRRRFREKGRKYFEVEGGHCLGLVWTGVVCQVFKPSVWGS